jgi:hypothetical protein
MPLIPISPWIPPASSPSKPPPPHQRSSQDLAPVAAPHSHLETPAAPPLPSHAHPAPDPVLVAALWPPATSPVPSDQVAVRIRSPASRFMAARSSTESSSAASSGLDFEHTALTLRLPGSDPDRKCAASTSDPAGSRSPCASDAPPSPKYAARLVGN